MDLAGIQRLMCSLPAVSRLLSLAHNATLNRAAIVFSSSALVCLGSASATAPQQRHPHAERFCFGPDHITCKS